MSSDNLSDNAVDFTELGPSVVSWTQRYRLRARRIDQDFLIDVAWPPVAPSPDLKLPVIFVLDGNHGFGIATSAARSIQSGPCPLPPALVVGVGYHFERPEDEARWATLRFRDLSPCGDRLLQEQYGGDALCGGADAFLDFISDELKPFLAERYPVDPNDSTVVGASLGGLLALHALFTRPETFQRYVAISPAIYWGDGHVFAREADYADTATDLPARLFLGAGTLEEAHDARQGFVSNIYQLEARLRRRAYPSLDVKLRAFDGETHMSVFPAAVTRGLGEVFGGYRDMHDWSRWMQAVR